MKIDPLLSKLEALAPQFGRAREDIEAMVSRGRSGDYKGVMQNARLVLETLLRAMVVSELKQTPGKAMLDELITKFRQQTNQGLVPTNVLAHMGTVQAWGNLSSHDHALGLEQEAIKVGPDEALASLNSMVAILTWYASRGGLPAPTPAPASNVASKVEAAPSTQGAPEWRERRNPYLILALIPLAGLLAGAGYLARTSQSHWKDKVDATSSSGTDRLDALYRTWGEQPPPVACRVSAEHPALAPVAEDAAALAALNLSSPEAHYLLGRALQEKRDPGAAKALQPALACVGFAAAHSLAGRIAVSNQRLDDAVSEFQQALAGDPNYQNARYNLGVVYLKQQKFAEAATELEHVTQSEPNRAEAHFFLGAAYEKLDRAPDATAQFCEAKKLGSKEAISRCDR